MSAAYAPGDRVRVKPRFEVRVEFTGYTVVDTSRRNKVVAWYPSASEAEAIAAHWNEEARLGRI